MSMSKKILMGLFALCLALQSGGFAMKRNAEDQPDGHRDKRVKIVDSDDLIDISSNNGDMDLKKPGEEIKIAENQQALQHEGLNNHQEADAPQLKINVTSDADDNRISDDQSGNENSQEEKQLNLERTDSVNDILGGIESAQAGIACDGSVSEKGLWKKIAPLMLAAGCSLAVVGALYYFFPDQASTVQALVINCGNNAIKFGESSLQALQNLKDLVLKLVIQKILQTELGQDVVNEVIEERFFDIIQSQEAQDYYLQAIDHNMMGILSRPKALEAIAFIVNQAKAECWYCPN